MLPVAAVSPRHRGGANKQSYRLLGVMAESFPWSLCDTCSAEQHGPQWNGVAGPPNADLDDLPVTPELPGFGALREGSSVSGCGATSSPRWHGDRPSPAGRAPLPPSPLFGHSFYRSSLLLSQSSGMTPDSGGSRQPGRLPRARASRWTCHRQQPTRRLTGARAWVTRTWRRAWRGRGASKCCGGTKQPKSQGGEGKNDV